MALRRSGIAVLGLCLAVAGAAPASAIVDTGGAYAGDPAAISAVTCAARCGAVGAVQPGSLVRVRGTNMRSATSIVFLGARGAADDVSATVVRARGASADALVPAKALSGPLLVVNRGGPSRPSRSSLSIQRIAAGGGPLDVKVVGRRVYLAATRQAEIDILPRSAMALTVALVRLSDGALVASWPLGMLTPGVVRTVNWNGTVAGVAQPVGRYEFRVFPAVAGVQAAQTATPLASGAFDLVGDKFPIRGKHTYGTGIAAFGAQRNGHIHEGQDVFAACGTPLVAARGGVVKLNQDEANAGNYIVIDAAGTDVDYVYMHLRRRSPLKKGALVGTGDPIGEVGKTGDATACHLHFELWSAPGWFTGGKPLDPLPSLKAWDAYS